MAYLTAQCVLKTEALHTCSTHTSSWIFALGSLKPFFAHLPYVARASPGLSGFLFERAQNTGGCLIIKPSPSISFAFYQPSSTRSDYLHLPLKAYISRCLSDGWSSSLDDGLANKHKQKILPNKLEVIQMLSICDSQLSSLTVSWYVFKGKNIWMDNNIVLGI